MRADILAELEQIAAENGGRIPLPTVVKKARNPKSAMHHRFTWDLKEAARKQNLEEAGVLVREYIVWIKLADGPEEIEVRGIHYVPATPEVNGGYMLLRDVRNHVGARELLIAKALKEADQWAKRYQNLRYALGPIFEAIESVTREKDQVA